MRQLWLSASSVVFLRRRLIGSAVILTVLFGMPASVPGQEGGSPSIFTLDALAQAGPEVALTVPSNGEVPLTIIRSGGKGPSSPVTLSLSLFIGDTRSTQVDLAIGKLPPQPEQSGILFNGPLLPVRLIVPAFPTPGKYTGRLFLTVAGQDSVTVWKIVLSGPQIRPAMLVIDGGGTVTRTATQPWCLFGWCPCLFGGDAAPTFSVRLHDKSWLWPLEGVTSRIDQVSKAPGGGFDLKRNATFSFANFATSAQGDSLLLPGKQGNIQVQLHDLEAGEYNATLRFQAANSVEDDAQRVTMSVQVRHSVVWAILMLLLALATSFLGTQFLGMLRQRASFLQRVHTLRPDWLAQEDPVKAAIWVRAVLRLATDRSRRFWLTGQSQIDARLQQAERVLTILDQARQLRTQFQQSLSNFPRDRAADALNRVLAKVDAHALSDQTSASARKDLDALTAWIQGNQQQGCYWADLSTSISKLVAHVNLDEVQDATARGVMPPLLATLANPTIPPSLEAMEAVEVEYVRLKLLWERRNAPEIGPLATLQQQKAPLNVMFGVANDAAWTRLEAASAAHLLTVPQSTAGDPIEAYDPISFKLETLDQDVGRTYLFREGLRYEWVITLAPRESRWRTRLKLGAKRPIVLLVQSTEPQAVQYVPVAGTLTASVTARYKTESLTWKIHECTATDATSAARGRRPEFLGFNTSTRWQLAPLVV